MNRGEEKTTGDVDRAAFRRRLDHAAAAAAQEPDERRAHRVLSERARLLARQVDAAAGAAQLELVTFALGGETWALSALHVWDVFEVAEFARLPGAQAPFTGVTAWRGTILTVLDLRSILGIPTAPLADLRFAIAVGTDRPAFGILADVVHDLVSLNTADLLDPPDGVAVHRDCLLGVTRSSLPVLDIERLVQRYG